MANQHRGVKLLTLSDGRNVARFTDPATRRQVQQSLDALGLTNESARHRWATEKVKALKVLRASIAATGAVPGRVAIKQAVADYLSTFNVEQTRLTKEAPLAGMRAFLAEHGIHETTDITGAAIAQYGDHVRRPANKHMVSTRNHYTSACATWLRWCRRRGLTPRVTDDMVKDGLRRQPAPQDAIEVLQPAQLPLLLKSCLAHDATEQPHVAPFALMVLLTGMRFSEAEGLLWDEVDIGAKVLRLSAARTKTKRHRIVTLSESPAALDVLKALRLQSGTQRRVFPDIDRTIADKLTHRLVHYFGAPVYTWTMLRRTCGSLLVCGGVGGAAAPFLTAKRLGHGLAVSEKHYLGTLLGLPQNCTSVEMAGGFETEAAAIVRSVAVVQPQAEAVSAG